MERFSSLSLIVAVLIGGGFFVYGKTLDRTSVPMPGSITVSADAKVSAVPDVAEVSLGIDTGRRGTAKEAMRILGEGMTKVLAAVKEQKIEDKDITTGSFSLNPEYDWSNGRSMIIGFTARQSLTIKIRELDSIQDVLSAATVAGANQAGQVQFSVDNPDAKEAEARALAIASAKAKAQALAKDLGVSLVRLMSFGEGGGIMPYPMTTEARMASTQGRDVLIAPPMPVGEQEITSTVTLTYEIK